jgi:hypothetical protein
MSMAYADRKRHKLRGKALAMGGSATGLANERATLYHSVSSDDSLPPQLAMAMAQGLIARCDTGPATKFFWKLNDLSMVAKATSPAQVPAGDPFGYVIGDSIPRVVYRGTNGHICELALY